MHQEIQSVFDTEVLEKYAGVLCWGLARSLGRDLVRGDSVLVRFDPPALPAAEALYEQLVDMGLYVSWRMDPTARMQKHFYQNASMRQLDHISPGEHEHYASLTGMIRILAPESLGHLAQVDPEVIDRAEYARKALRLMRDKREGMGLYAWTLGAYPTPALARIVGHDLEDYALFMARACLLTKADPVREWRDVSRRLAEIRDWLGGLEARAFRVESESMDLEVPFGERRRWLALTGQNIPSYEVYFSPDWRGVRGVYYSDLPSIRRGGVVRGVRLEFDQGRVVKAEAEQGLVFLLEALATDQGASRLGEFSLTEAAISNVNHFMGLTMFDENFGGEHGNCHVALGAAYPRAFDGDVFELKESVVRQLGFNNSSIHWDLVNTQQKTVTALLRDGGTKVIFEGGGFVY